MYNSNGLDDESNQEIEAFQRAMHTPRRPPELLRNAFAPRKQSVPGEESDEACRQAINGFDERSPNAVQAFEQAMQELQLAPYTPPQAPSLPPAQREMKW